MQKSMQICIFQKNCAACFLLIKAFQRAIKSQNPMIGSKSKYRFSRVKVKQGIQAACPRTQAVGIKARFEPKVKGQVLVRKVKIV